MSRVIVKLGGGLITDKTEYKHVQKSHISPVASVIKELVDMGHSVILVHGAGSFGHIESKKWRLADGYQQDIGHEQAEAMDRVRFDMLELNRHVVEALESQGLMTESLPPRYWANGVGFTFEGDMSAFVRGPSEPIPVTFGDVVDVADSSKFGILSGDHIMVRLGIELPDVCACLFLLGDVDGIMDRPPGQSGARLIEQWAPSDGLVGTHASDIDVTGGIQLKARCASMIANSVDSVWLLNGRKPNRMLDVVARGVAVGTKVVKERSS